MAAELQEIKDAADSALHDNSHASGELILLDVSKGICLQSELRRLEQELIKQALILTEGHQRLAAQLLGIKPTTLHSKIKKFSLLEEQLTSPQD